MLADDFDSLTPVPSMTPEQAKSLEGAHGRPTCSAQGSPVTGGVERRLTLYGCGLVGGQRYALFTYVEAAGSLEADGNVTGPLRFEAQAASNHFRAAPTIDTATMSKDAVTVKFAASAPAGYGYAMIVSEASYSALKVADVKAFLTGEGDGTCKWRGYVSSADDPVQVRLSACRLLGGRQYRVFVYVEDAREKDDGTLSEPLVLQVPLANSFAGLYPFPRLAATPTRFEVHFVFQVQTEGKAWAVVLPENAAVSATATSIKSHTGAYCWRSDVPVLSDRQTNLLVSGCDLLALMLFKGVVYVEDAAGQSDGTAGPDLDVWVPGNGTSNTFTAYPEVVLDALNNTASSDGLTVTLAGSNYEGRLWASVVDAEFGDCMSIRSMKSQHGAKCYIQGLSVTDQIQTIRLTGCNLKGSESFRLYVYLEARFNGDDGVFAPALSFQTPPSNSFDEAPKIVGNFVSVDGLRVTFQASAAQGGRAWASITAASSVGLVDAHSMKVGTHALGSAGCRIQGAEVGGGAEELVLEECALQRGLTYSLFVYVEGMNTSYSDGSLSDPLSLTVPSTSLQFSHGPYLFATPSADIISVAFTAQATDTAASAVVPGVMWAMVVERTAAQVLTVEAARRLEGALGSPACQVERRSLASRAEVRLELRDCMLKVDSSYTTVVYIEDDKNRSDGTLRIVDTNTPPGFSNGFAELPTIVGTPTSDNVTVEFAALQPVGRAWVSVVSADAAVSQTAASVIAGQGALGSPQWCRFSDVAISDVKVQLELSACSLPDRASFQVRVHAAGPGGHADGLVATAGFTTGPANTFVNDPALASTPTIDGVDLTFEASQPGRAWVLLVAVANAPRVTRSTIKTAQFWALGGPACQKQGQAIVGPQTSSLSGCSLAYGTTYKAFVYIEDIDAAGSMGTLSAAVDVPVPGSAIFVGPQYLVRTPRSSGVDFAFQPVFSERNGLLWAEVATPAAASAFTPELMREGVPGMPCSIAGLAVTSEAQQLSVTGCNLEYGIPYHLLIYVEVNGFIGTMSAPLEFIVPVSNDFAQAPAVTGAPHMGGVDLLFAATGAGMAWGVVVSASDAASVTTSGASISSLKAGLGALGACRVASQAIPAGAALQTMNIAGCALVMNTTAKAFVYIEDSNGLGDGRLSEAFDVVLPASNGFADGPWETRTPRSAAASLSFTPVGSGLVWAMITSDTSSKTVGEVKAMTGAVGGTCGVSAVTVYANVEKTLDIYNCGLVPGQSYKAYVYIENALGNNDGTLAAAIVLRIASNTVPNSFGVSPRLTGSVTGNGFSLSYQLASPGRVHAIVVPQSATVSISTLLAGAEAVGGASCSYLPPTGLIQTSTSMQLLDFVGCSLLGGSNYAAYVYADYYPGAWPSGAAALDGVMTGPLEIYVPYSNRLVGDPELGNVDGAEIQVAFNTTASSGYAWLAVHSSDADPPNISAARDVGSALCGIERQSVSSSSVNNLTISGCTLLAGVSYRLSVLVEDQSGNNDGQLTLVNVIVPFSNAFTEGPRITSTVLATELAVAFSAATAGHGFAKLFGLAAPNFTDVAGMEATPAQELLCQSNVSWFAAGSQSLRVTGCALEHGRSYKVYIYIAGDNLYQDGTLSGPLIATVAPGRSSCFTEVATLVPDSLMPSGFNLSFSAAVDGLAWLAAAPATAALDIAATTTRSSNVPCALHAVPVKKGRNTLSIQGCGFAPGTEYHAMVYVTNAAAGRDGTLSGAVHLYIIASNGFLQDPYLAQVPSSSHVIARVRTNSSGRVWAALVAEVNYTEVSSVALQDPSFGVCRAGPLSTVGITTETELQLTGCGLAEGVGHRLWAYAEGASGQPTGVLSEPVAVALPPSNSFLGPVVLDSSSNLTNDTFTLQYELAKISAAVYAGVVRAADADSVSIAVIRNNNPALLVGGSNCRISALSSGRSSVVQSWTFTGCGFTKGTAYQAYVYAEHVAGNQDGSLSNAVNFTIPASNSLSAPLLLTSTPTRDGVAFSFTALSSGRAWAQVQLARFTASTSVAHVKAATYAASSNASCRRVGENVLSGELTAWSLSGCGLIPGVPYNLVLYLEDSNGLGDGTIESVAMTVPLVSSNYFTELPIVASTPTPDGVTLQYAASNLSGNAWAMLLAPGATSVAGLDGLPGLPGLPVATVATVDEIKRGANSLGGPKCKPAEVVIDNERQSLVLSDCGLTRGQTYHALVYVEGSSEDSDPGVWQAVDVAVPVLSTLQDPTARSWTDTGVTGGQGYVYHVRPVNFIGIGKASSSPGKFWAGSVPAAPGLPVIASRTQTSFNVQWAPPSSMGFEITEYRLFMLGQTDEGVFKEVYRGPDTSFTKANLVTGQLYSFQVSALNALGEGLPSAVKEVATCLRPTIPGPMTVKYRLTTEIAMRWSPPSNDGGCPVTAYVVKLDGVQMARQTHREFVLRQVPPLTITPGQRYEFDLRVETMVGSSAWHGVVPVVAAQAPARVGQPRITNMSDAGIGLDWEGLPSSLNGGVPVLAYRIYMATDDQEYTAWGDTNSLTTSAFIDGLADGGRYCFKVAAVNSVTETNPLLDQLPARSEPPVCGTAASPPQPPGSVYFDHLRRGELRVRWPPTLEDGGSAVELYELTMNPNSSGWIWVATNVVQDLNHVVEGCIIGQRISFRLRARNAVGWGGYGPEGNTACALEPEMLLAPTRSASTRTSITVTWVAPEDNGAPISAYRLYQAAGAGAFFKIYQGMSLQYESVGLAEGTNYSYTVTAVNEIGESNRSNATLMLCAAPPTKPTGVSFSQRSRNDTVVSWTAPADDGGSSILRYEVWYRDGLDAGPIDKLAWSGASTTSDVITFVAGYALQVQVAAVNTVVDQDSKPGTRSDVFIYHAAELPGAPANTVLSSSSLVSATLAWSPPEDSGGLPVLSYRVYVDDGLGGSLAQVYDGTATSYEQVGLNSGYTYRFEVKALTAKGEGNSSRLNVVPCSDPGDVGNLRVLQRSGSVIRLGWDPPSDEGACPILGYTIQSGTDAARLQVVGTTSSAEETAFSFYPASPDLGFLFRVRAENWKSQLFEVAGAGSDIYVIGASTPDAPTGLRMTGSTPTSISLSWTAPQNDGGSPITKYFVQRNDGLGGSEMIDATSGTDMPTSTTYTVTGLTSAYYYAFQIAAANRVLETNPLNDLKTNFTEAFFYAASVPDPPGSPTVVEGSRTSAGFTVEWTAPSYSGGIPLLGYNLYRDNGANDNINVSLWSGTGQPAIQRFTISSGLLVGTIYRLAVTAVNGAGESQQSVVASIAHGTAPARMSVLERDPSVIRGTTSVQLRWSAPSDGGSPIIKYILRYDNGDFTDFTNERNYSSTTFSDGIASQPEGRFVRFQIFALNAIGLSAGSRVYRTQICGNPDPVSSFEASDFTDQSVNLSWTAPINTGCVGAVLRGYKIFMRAGTNAYGEVHDGGPAQLSMVQQGLVQGGAYTFKIYVCGADSCDVEYPSSGLQVIAGRSPVFGEQPFKFSEGTQTSMNLSWTPPRGLPIIEYQVLSDNAAGTGGSIVNQVYLGAAATFVMQQLTTGAVYRFQIRARNINGYGPLSGIVRFISSMAPRAPRNLRWLASDTTTIKVGWDEPLEVHALQAKVVRYEVAYSDQTPTVSPVFLTEGKNFITPPAVKAATPPEPLLVGHTYRFQVRACSINECGPYTSNLDMLCGSLAEAPMDPYLFSSTFTSIALGWDYVGRDSGGVPITGYNVKVSSDGGATYSLAGTTDGSTLQFTYGCSSSQMFYFKVAPKNGVGGSDAEGHETTAVGMFCAPPPESPGLPVLSSTRSSVTVQLYEPTAEQLGNASHQGWRVLINDVNGSDRSYQEHVLAYEARAAYTISSGIVTGHHYNVKLRLCNQAGCSLESAISGPYLAASPPDAPSRLYATASSDSQLAISWEFGLGHEDGGSAIFVWRIYVSIDGETWPDQASPTAEALYGNTRTYDIDCSALGASQRMLWVKVAGVSLAGTGAYSDTLASRCSAAPETPAAPSMVNSSSEHITITWKVPTTSELHQALHKGTVVLHDDGAGGPFSYQTLTNTLQVFYTRTGVNAGHAYRFRVQTLSEIGKSLESDTLLAVAAAPPDAPSLVVTSTSNIAIEYSILAGSSGGSPITSWQVYASQDGTAFPTTPLAALVVSTTRYTLDCTNFNGMDRRMQNFWVKISASNIAGEGLASSPATKTRCSSAPEAPLAPRRVTSTSKSVTISFAPQGLNGALLTGFKIFADDGSDGSWTIDTVTDIAQRTFTKYGLTTGQTCRFQVQVVTEAGTSALSPIASYMAAAVPEAPELSITSSTNTEVNLAWTARSDGGSPVVSWYVFGSRDGVTWPNEETPQYVLNDASTTTLAFSCTDESKWGGGVQVSTQFAYFRVLGVNAAGRGTASVSRRWRCSAVPSRRLQAAPATPSAPTYLVGWPRGVTVGLPKPTSLNGAIFMGYKLYYGLGGQPHTELVLESTGTDNYTISGLLERGPYEVRVKFVTDVGDSAMSDVMSFMRGAVPGAPGAPTYRSSSQNTITFEFTTPADDGGDTIGAFNIYTSSSYETGWPSQAGGPYCSGNVIMGCTYAGQGADTTRLQIPCPTGTDVYIRVNAQSNAGIVNDPAQGMGPYSPTSRFFCNRKAEAPMVTQIGGSPDSITLDMSPWICPYGDILCTPPAYTCQNPLTAAQTACTFASRGDELMGYNIYLAMDNGGPIQEAEYTLRGSIWETSISNITIRGLIAGQEYSVKVAAVTHNGEGAQSAAQSVRACGLPSVPPKPGIVRRQCGAGGASCLIEMRWTLPDGNGCPITRFLVYKDNEINPADDISCASAADCTSWTASNLVKGQVYRFKVRAVNARGSVGTDWLENAKAISVPGKMNVAPAADATQCRPSSVNLQDLYLVAPSSGCFGTRLYSTSTSIFITWEDLGTQWNEGFPVGFKVYRNDGGTTEISSIADPTCGREVQPTRYCVITGLQQGTTYRFKVSAINEVGEGPLSDETSKTTGGFPHRITDLTLDQSVNTDAYTQSRLRVHWTIPDNGGQALRGYTGEVEDLTDPSGSITYAGNVNDDIDPATANIKDEYLEGLTRSHQYRFRVAAENPKGFGDWSDWTLTTGPQAGYVMDAPAAVANLRRHSDAPVSGKIKLIWDTPTVADAGGEQAANIVYSIHYQAAQTGPYLLAGTTAGVVIFEHDVPASQINNYKVTLTNRAGYSTQTPTAIALKSGEAPGQIASVTIASTAYQTLSMTWTAPASDGGDPITGYQMSSDAECVTEPCNSGATADYLSRQEVFEVPLSACTPTCSYDRQLAVANRVGPNPIVTVYIRAKNSVASGVAQSASSQVCQNTPCPPGNVR
eukprot:TRINITY_DN17949_c0_g2_i3.p1 TRINITY_DN17949_c0_g2~~TRINITY_DN17949_c0_g2_i3.p1  ORF type:complete len:5308 (+),score=711.55 TRINITY_DN17949_c0_g2_i3:64-15987(+)